MKKMHLSNKQCDCDMGHTLSWIIGRSFVNRMGTESRIGASLNLSSLKARLGRLSRPSKFARDLQLRGGWSRRPRPFAYAVGIKRSM